MEIQRDRPSLRDDAVPTIFPDVPSYFTQKLPKKRKSENICQQLLRPRKRKKQEKDGICGAADNLKEETRTTSTQPSDVFQPYCSLQLPTHYWSKIAFRNDPSSTHYALCEPESHRHVKTTKLVIFSSLSSEGVACCCVYFRGVKTAELEVHTAAEAESELLKAENATMCPGTALKPLGGKSYLCFGSSYFSKYCTVQSEDEQPCLHCKYLKRLIQNQISRRRGKNPLSDNKKRSKRNLALFKAKKKVHKARKTIE